MSPNGHMDQPLPEPPPRRPGEPMIPRLEPTIPLAQVRLAAMLGVVLIGALVANFMLDRGFEQSGLYFVALPGMMAIWISLLPKSDPTTRISRLRATVIAVLASAMIVREGIVCVLMALPLILLVTSIMSGSSKRIRERRNLAFVLPMLLLGVSGEGVVYELPTHVVVSETRTFDVTSAELLDSLAQPCELPELSPLLFALPFPKPSAFNGDGLYLGALRTVEFGEMGVLELTVSELDDSHVTWEFTNDSTPMSNWMTIHEATASWVETPTGLAVTVSIDFDRALAPAFYFDPLERWGVGELAEVILDVIDHNIERRTTDG